jgi:hypothetical protein
MSGQVAVAGKVVARTLTLLLAGGALACDDGPLEDLLGPLKDPSVIMVSASIDRDSTRPGDVLHVTVTARNPTRHRFGMDPALARGGLLLEFEVRSPDGTLVWPDRGGLVPLDPLAGGANGARTRRYELGPFQSLVARFDWTAMRESYTWPSGKVTTALPSGTYKVTGRLNVVGGRRSEPVSVRVLPVLTLTLDVEPAVPAPGDTVTITTTVTNESDKRVTIPDLGSCRFGLWVGRLGSLAAHLTECPVEERQLALFPQRSTWRVLRWQAGESGDYVIVADLAGTIQPDLLITRPLVVR